MYFYFLVTLDDSIYIDEKKLQAGYYNIAQTTNDYNEVHLNSTQDDQDGNMEYFNEGEYPVHHEYDDITDYNITDYPKYLNRHDTTNSLSVEKGDSIQGRLPFEKKVLNLDATHAQHAYVEAYNINGTLKNLNSNVTNALPTTALQQQEADYERYGNNKQCCNQSGWYKKHKILVAVGFAILITMLITSGIFVGVIMVATKQDSEIRETSTIPSFTTEDTITEATMSVTTTDIASLVVIGGEQRVDGKYISLNTVDIYHLNSGNITLSHQGQLPPYIWTNAGRAVDKGNIYVLGGFAWKPNHHHGFRSGQNGVGKYNVDNNTWDKLPDITWGYKGGSPAVFIHQNKLYICSL